MHAHTTRRCASPRPLPHPANRTQHRVARRRRRRRRRRGTRQSTRPPPPFRASPSRRRARSSPRHKNTHFPLHFLAYFPPTNASFPVSCTLLDRSSASVSYTQFPLCLTHRLRIEKERKKERRSTCAECCLIICNSYLLMLTSMDAATLLFVHLLLPSLLPSSPSSPLFLLPPTFLTM